MASKPYKSEGGFYYIVWKNRTKQPLQVAESLKTTSLTEARRRKADLETKYHQGSHDPWKAKWYETPEPRGYDLQGLLDVYKAHKIAQTGRYGWKTPITVKSKYNVIKQFVGWIGHSDINQIKKEHVMDFYNARGMSDGGRKSYNGVLMSFFKWAYDNGFMGERISVEVAAPQKDIPPYITPEDLEALCTWHRDFVIDQLEKKLVRPDSNHSWMADAWIFLARSGLRPNEFIKLRVDDVRNNQINVGSWYTTKTRLQRIVPVFDEVAPIIRKYTNPRYRQNDQHLRDSDRLFGRSSEIAKRRLNEAFAMAITKSTPYLSGCTLYSLRHTFAVWYLYQPTEHSMDFKLTRLMYLLGHRDVTTTQEYLRAIAGMK